MNRLQKKVWKELLLVTICTIFIILAMFSMAQRNVKGIGYIIICLIVGIPTGIFGFIWELKEFCKLDERERKIYQKAFRCACGGLLIYQFCFAFFIFFAIGGKGNIPVLSFPIMFFTSVFVAQSIQSVVILIKCALEEDE